MKEVNTKLLTRIYQDAKIGAMAIDNVIDKAKDDDFKGLLSRQKDAYENVAFRCEEIAKKGKTKLPDNSFFTKVKQNIMINMSLFMDDTTRHIAEIMITGTTMGIIDATKSLYDLSKADDEIVSLGQKLDTLQEQYIDELKKFLK